MRKNLLNKNEVLEIIELLQKEYPDAGCELDYDSTFHLLIAVVLSAQTTDVMVNKVTPNLFKEFNTPKELANADIEKVENLIKKIGLYKNKAKNIVALSNSIENNFNGSVPNNFDDLISLEGVGRKTANVVLAEAFGEQKIAVDTHVFRVSNRIGIVNEKDVLKTEKALMKKIPKKYWTKMHHLLIIHGRRCCMARKPECFKCPLKTLCINSLLK